MKVPIPDGQYIKSLNINSNEVDIEFLSRKKIALIFVCVNQKYWPYFAQVIEDCKTHFLPHHNVDYFVWSDIPTEDTKEYKEQLKHLIPVQQLIESHELAKKEGFNPPQQWWGREVIEQTVKVVRENKKVTVFPTEGIDWPAPTLMRYHLFLQQEEKLAEYDHIFYLDADMRVVSKISDEIINTGLVSAEHPMYSLRSQLVPPYEPNENSTAYIKRPGRVIDDNGKPRFKPYYWAGGFQGGVASEFIKAMKVMRTNIDKDFSHNYVAIWNDESHWNKYLSDYTGDLVVLPPSYIYPDSLIKEYYEPIWGRSYEPKIITLTKPFTISKAGGDALNEYLGREKQPGQEQPPRITFVCPTCKDQFDTKDYLVKRVVQCNGSGKPHQLDMQKQ